ncbi:hypothetical protein [Glycomyces buryatensis]|uniref:Uncharacterized protein n=1 Tax=Glycomyces buryatensis TaxID=2570927 RepID=A0A4S8QJF8_9ACTN|nr:hypothetical protein [Glycomyces buryatensis]THV40874.1 hypothetical protein FAB82_13550 [Glycomyces buryatensis]
MASVSVRQNPTFGPGRNGSAPHSSNPPDSGDSAHPASSDFSQVAPNELTDSVLGKSADSYDVPPLQFGVEFRSRTVRPHDPDDPGVFGTPGWRPDPRTGRHRRGELPDPLPPSNEETPEPSRPSAGPPHQANPEPAWPPVSAPRPAAGASRPSTPARGFDVPHRFSQLREAAFDRFMTGSEVFARAHDTEMTPGRWERTWTKVTGWCKGLIRPAIRSRAPEAPAAHRKQPAPQPTPQPTPQPVPQVPQQRTGNDRPRPNPSWRYRVASHQVRTARFARALGGARLARSEPEHRQADRRNRSFAAWSPHSPEVTTATTTSTTTPTTTSKPTAPRLPAPGSLFIAAWERAFDAGPGLGQAVAR